MCQQHEKVRVFGQRSGSNLQRSNHGTVPTSMHSSLHPTPSDTASQGSSASLLAKDTTSAQKWEWCIAATWPAAGMTRTSHCRSAGAVATAYTPVTCSVMQGGYVCPQPKREASGIMPRLQKRPLTSLTRGILYWPRMEAAARFRHVPPAR